MNKIKIGLSGLNVPDQIEHSRHVQTNMTGNANFATPLPTLATVKTVTDALETAWNESRNRDRNKIQIMKLRRVEFLAVLIQLAAYVQSASDGDKEKILSSGFAVIERGVPQPPVGQVLNLRASNGIANGSIKLLWDKMPGAKVYMVQISPDPFSDASFELKATSTKTRCEITGLTTGKKYWFAVAAIGKDGFGPWSEPSTDIAK